MNSKTWIGATEAVTLLTVCHIRTKLIDFHRPTGRNGTHPLLFEWVKNYFEQPTSASNVSIKHPLFLQHQVGFGRSLVWYKKASQRGFICRYLFFSEGKKFFIFSHFFSLFFCRRLRSARKVRFKIFFYIIGPFSDHSGRGGG